MNDPSSKPTEKPLPDPDVANRMKQMLAQIWRNNESTLRERLAAISRAQSGLREGILDQQDREQARAAAHKLAGVLGTFGLPQGTELARRAEELMQLDGAAGPDEAERLAAIVQELEGLIDAKSQELA